MKKVVLIISLVLIGFTACENEEEKLEVKKAIPVRIAKVESKRISVPIHTSGKLSSKSESKLSFKTGGIVQQIFVEEGESVKRGQVLARLDLGEIQAKVNQAKAGFSKTERDFQRVESLYKDSVVTLEQLQNVTTGLDVAKSNMEIANFNLKHSQIVAPSNGRILKRFVEKNEMVGPGTPIIIFGKASDFWIMRVGVTDKNITKLKYGNKAKVTIDALPNEPFDAVVTEVASAANPYNGTYEVELTIKTKSTKLISGMIANAEVFTNSDGESKVIPIGALVNADGKNGSVFIPTENGIAKKINVEIEGIVEDNVIIKNGLENVSDVIIDGVEYLMDGERVKIMEAGEGRQEAGKNN